MRTTCGGNAGVSGCVLNCPNDVSLRRPQATSVVHIFDLDETLIQFNHLGTGAYATRTNKDGAVGKQIGAGLEHLVVDIAERHFFFAELERCNQCSVADLAQADDGQELGGYAWGDDGFSWPSSGALPEAVDPLWKKLAYRIREMARRYEEIRVGPGSNTEAANLLRETLDGQAAGGEAGEATEEDDVPDVVYVSVGPPPAACRPRSPPPLTAPTLHLRMLMLLG